MRRWDVAHAAVGSMVASALLVLFFLILTKDAPVQGLPSRPDTGNHGQGHSPQPGCPGQYDAPVDVDGVKFNLTCFGKKITEVTQFSDETKSPNAAWTEKAPLVYRATGGEMETRMVLVPSYPEYVPYICFALENARSVQCLYMGTTQYTAHKVEQRPVVLDEVNL